MAKKSSDIKLPAKVKVGWRTYRFIDWPHMEAVAAGCYGQTSHLNETIKIDLSLPDHVIAATVFHEIMHAVTNVWVIKDDDKEERRIELMEAGIMTMWRDNPTVMAWIGFRLA